MKQYIHHVIAKKNLSHDKAEAAFTQIMSGEATPVEMTAFLVGLKMKGETIAEITAAAQVLRRHGITIAAPNHTLDTCGTGGDHSGSFNISTAVALVLAGCNIPVAKHGNRSVSSSSGSADVLQALGVNIHAAPAVMEHCLAHYNVCFLMAPHFHPAMRHVAEVRKALALRTIFNILGPLANPARAEYQLLGVYERSLLNVMAQVLHNMDCKAAWVVCGEDGMDELTLTGKSYIAQLKEGTITNFTITPEDAGLKRCLPNDLRGGNARENAQELKALLQGKGSRAYRDVVLLNAAAGLVVAGYSKTLTSAVHKAASALDEGKAYQCLQNLIEVSNHES